MGDGRAEGSSAIGDGGRDAISHTPGVDGTHVGTRIFESSQLEGLYIGNLLYSKKPIAQYSGAQFCVLSAPPHFHFGPTNHAPEFLHKLPAHKVPPFEGVMDSVCSRSVPLSIREDEDFSSGQMCDAGGTHSCLHPVVALYTGSGTFFPPGLP